MYKFSKAIILVASLWLGPQTIAYGPPATSKHQFSLGGLLMLVPEYQGAKQYQTILVPNFAYKYRNFIHLSPSGGISAHCGKPQSLSLTLGARYKFWFRSKRQARFSFLEDLTPYGEAYLEIRKALQQTMLKLGLYRPIRRTEIGSFMNLGAYYRLTAGKKGFIFFGPSIKVSTSKHLNTLYGISEKQLAKAASGGQLKVDELTSGIEDMKANIGISYQLNRQWSMHSMVSLKRLLAKAAKSQLMDSKWEVFANFSLSRRF